MSILGLILYQLISLLFGTLGFWTPEVWAPKFLFFMLTDISAGKLFPLDIFPSIIQNIMLATPFPYFSYIQVQVFLGRYSMTQAWWSLAGLVGWIISLSLLLWWVWHRGMKDYSAAGN